MMFMNKKIVIVLLIIAVFGIVTGSMLALEQAHKTEEYRITRFCKIRCEQKLNEGQNLSSGPCLSNPLPESSDWVCDVAHNPRSQIDNLPENQCNAFGKTAKHFVEMDENCNLIRAV